MHCRIPVGHNTPTTLLRKLGRSSLGTLTASGQNLPEVRLVQPAVNGLLEGFVGGLTY